MANPACTSEVADVLRREVEDMSRDAEDVHRSQTVVLHSVTGMAKHMAVLLLCSAHATTWPKEMRPSLGGRSQLTATVKPACSTPPERAQQVAVHEHAAGQGKRGLCRTSCARARPP